MLDLIVELRTDPDVDSVYHSGLDNEETRISSFPLVLRREIVRVVGSDGKNIGYFESSERRRSQGRRLNCVIVKTEIIEKTV